MRTGELFVSRIDGRIHAALREEGATVEFRVEQDPRKALVGRIIKARVTKIMPGMQSAFMDIGEEHGALLHHRDLILPGETHAGVLGRGAGQAGPLEDRLEVGRELLVQIARERFGTKGARVTTSLGIAGRLLVLLPQARNRGVSRRIRDVAERDRLLQILGRLPGEELGLIARTAAGGASHDELAAEAGELLKVWTNIQAKASSLAAPAVVHREAGLVLQLLQEAPAGHLDRILFDDEDDRKRAVAYLEEVDAVSASKVALHVSPPGLFEAYGLHEEMKRALQPQVRLKSGGYLIIEETEALISIDVNTGSYLGERGLDQTALRTNLEAAMQIPRQLRLRQLGGIIVIDLIDMAFPESRRRVLEALTDEMARDPERTKIAGLSELGLVQLTRKRTRPPLSALMTECCPCCGGHGRVADSRGRDLRAAEGEAG